MNDTFSFTLESPLTEEQINLITDAELEHTDRIWFDTPKGKHIEFVKAPHWIPADERLPEDVLCETLVTDGINVWVETWVGIVGKWKYNHSAITAWMPLPDPWKGEEDGRSD